MTMSNQMALSSASVAVMANNNTLVNMGAMQDADFTLSGSTIKASLEATSVQAAADEKSIIDQAQATKTTGEFQMGGAIAGLGSTAAGLIGGSIFSSQAGVLETPPAKVSMGLSEETDTELTTFKSSSPVVEPGTTAAPDATAKLSGELDTSTDASSPTARVEGKLDTEDDERVAAQKALNAKDATATAETKKTEVSDANATMAKNLRGKADMFYQNGNTFGSLLNGAGQGAGGVFSYDSMVSSGQQKKINDLEQGIAAALNTEVGLINSQLSNLDQSRSSTYQLMSTLQQHQG